jgi:hypothetical protein
MDHPKDRMPPRRRWLLLPLLLLVPVLGLGSRSRAAWLPDFIAAYAGDTLWAAMVYFCLVFLLPRLALRHAAIAALALSFLVEFSQLYHAPWLDVLRAHKLGALLLGRGFLGSDLLCYTAGVALAAGTDLLLPRQSPQGRHARPQRS